MSAADKPSEYLKRTCLICGCHTNQTINIYEPRSGPNIVQLIQAKFKFQPLNDDKYLCFSCNNWLINWHSLQALNSNDAESPSGTFRSSQVNGGMAQEKRAGSKQQQQTLQQEQPQQKPIVTCRPVAQVRPRQLLTALETGTELRQPIKVSASSRTTSTQESTSATNSHRNGTKSYFAKRNFRGNTYLQRCSGIKQLSACSLCGQPIVLRIRGAHRALILTHRRRLQQTKRMAKCRKCRTICKWRSIICMRQVKHYTRSSNYSKTPKSHAPSSRSKHLVNQSNQVLLPSTAATVVIDRPHENQSNKDFLKRPLVDGKVVAMLRRLGTTLSRECVEVSKSVTVTNSTQAQLPPIMSPTKPKPRWTRPLEVDEIPLQFETAISEVLPILQVATKTNSEIQTKSTRRQLKYQVSCETSNEYTSEQDMKDESNLTNTMQQVEYENLFDSLPKGLNISLI